LIRHFTFTQNRGPAPAHLQYSFLAVCRRQQSRFDLGSTTGKRSAILALLTSTSFPIRAPADNGLHQSDRGCAAKIPALHASSPAENRCVRSFSSSCMSNTKRKDSSAKHRRAYENQQRFLIPQKNWPRITALPAHVPARTATPGHPDALNPSPFIRTCCRHRHNHRSRHGLPSARAYARTRLLRASSHD